MKINYPAYSPYSNSTQTTWYMGPYRNRPIPPSVDDKEMVITPQYEHRPDLLSNDLYGTPAYWWIFTVRNRSKLNHPIWDMTVGKKIMVPTVSHLQKSLGT